MLLLGYFFIYVTIFLSQVLSLPVIRVTSAMILDLDE